MDTLPVWKRVYPIIASSNPNVTISVTEDVINICKTHITDVLLPYKCYSRENFVKWKCQRGLQEIVSDDEMCDFIHKLSKQLDLDAYVVWTLICNFLMYEYYGKVDELKALIKFDSKIEHLSENIWYFYSADRMFLLKTLRHILENSEDKSPTFQKKIETYRKTLNVSLLWKNLVKVFSNLIQEITKEKINMVPTELLPEWIHRNNREQLEVILLLMHTINDPDIKLTGSELQEILELFIKHGFTRLPFYAEGLQISRKADLVEIKNAEIALVLTILHRYWTLPEKIKIVMLPEDVARNMEWQHTQGDNSIVLFAWYIFKTYYNKAKTDEFDMEICNTMVQKMFERKLFVSLYELLIHKTFLRSKAGDILVEAMYTLMVEFFKICADSPYVTEQPRVAKLTAEFVKRKGLDVLENLGQVFQTSMEAFPFVFEPFLDMCEALLVHPGKYENVIELLNKIPGFLAEIPWGDQRDRFVMNMPQKLFTDSDLFVIPSGTTVERFLYQGNEYTRFHHPFSFFVLMEQFIMTFSTITFEIGPNWHYYKKLRELVLIGYKFINHLLKHYNGDYRKDNELRTLVKRLDVVPVQFCEGLAKNFDFIRLYFEVNCTLITHELLDYMEAFPPLQRKKFMPAVVCYDKKHRDNLFGQLGVKCFLFKSLKDEELMETHSLLLQYLELIHFMVKKNIYHYEVQLPGLWYIINCTFPLFQHWTYEDPDEKTKISKYCLSIFLEILQRHLSPVQDNSVVIFELVLDSFFNEDILVFSYMSMFPKDKFYLQNLMEQESNWTNGGSLENLDCLRLQLVLLILFFKHKSKSKSRKNTLDNHDGFFAYGITPYIINPYSLSLRKLSCRFLEILSREQHIPLMALLGLDYDQIQRLYLDRLRDPTEDDDLKLHILDLIGTCVVYQHGMTAAFFNVKRSRKWYSDNKERTIEVDTVSDFMVDFLQNMKRSPDYLRNPLQIGILHVMASLWSQGKQHLIDDVIGLKDFWPLLGNPLFRAFDQSPKIYAYILQIYQLQLQETDLDEKFLTSVDKFVTDTAQVKAFVDFIMSTFSCETPSIEDVEDKKLLLESCMKFIIVLEKSGKVKNFSELSRFHFVTMTLDGINLPLVNVHCLSVWLDFLLLQISHWKMPTENVKMLMLAEQSVKLLNIIKLHYIDLDHATRLSVLTIIQFLLETMRVRFEASSNELVSLVEQFGPMFEHEYNILEENHWRTAEGFDYEARELMLPWIICVRIVNGLFEYENVGDIGVWLTYRNVLQKFMDSTCHLVKNPVTYPLVKILLHGLALYAKSDHHLDFVNVNMDNFFGQIEPFIIQPLFDQNVKTSPLQLEEAWVICSLLIKFLTCYFQSLQEMTLPVCYNFITLNEHILGHAFNILETSVALKALDLVQNTLVLIDSIFLQWRLEWYKKSNYTYNFVVNGVTKVVNASLYAILRPKNIVVHVLDEKNRFHQLDKFPVDLMVAIMNRLVTIAGQGFSILYKVNPNLLTLLETPLCDTMKIIIENDFSVPKFELPISNKLTYGMLLCLAHFLCKSVDTLNLQATTRPTIPGITGTTSSGIATSGTSSTGSTTKVTTSKSELTRPSEDYLSRYFGMVEHQDFTHNMPTQKLSAFLRYAMYEYSGLADPWIEKLDFDLVRYSLESLMLFLAQQIFLSLSATEAEHISFFRRNLSSELQFFYEHTKKTASILINSESLSVAARAETDILKRYLLHYKETNEYFKVADNNFCMVISYWFIHLCKLR